MADAKRDSNYVPTLLAVSNADGVTPVTLYADPTTHRLLVSATSGSLDSLSDVVITTEAQGDILYFNGTNWVNLPAGTSGYFLKTQGSGANPVWVAGASAPSGTQNEIAYFDTTTSIASLTVATYPSLTELSYVKGVTSAIQTQLNAKGDVSKVGTPVDNQIGVWTGDGTLEGDTALTFDTATNVLLNEGKIASGTSDTMTVNGATITANFQGHSDTLAVYESHTHSDTAGSGGIFYSARSRGTELAQTVVQSGDTLGAMSFVGYDGTDYATSSAIFATVDGTPGNNDMPGRLTFYTSPDGSQTLAERMHISAAGNVNIAGLTASEIVITDASKNLVSAPVATYPSLTELTYVKGVTSAIQTQIGTKMTNPMTTGGDVIYGGASGVPTRLANGTVGQVLTSGGTTAAPTWEDAGVGDMVLASVQTVTGAKTFGSAGAVGKLKVAGTTSGSVTLDTDAVAGTAVITIPAVTDTLVGKATTDTFTNKTFDADGTGNSITNIENADIKAAAAIDVNKLAALTASEIVITDGSGFISSAAVATYPSLTELTYVKGVTSAIQTQLGTKAPSTAPTFATSITGSYLTASEILITDGSKNVVSAAVATYPSLTELTYVKGVTSAIQTQLDAKLALAGGTMTGDIQLGETDIKLDEVLSGDEKWSGIVIAGTAGATVAVGDVCYLASTGKWLLNDGILDGTDTGFSKQLGICVLASTDTNPTEMLTYGKVRSAAFPAFTVGSAVYLSDTAGDLVVAQPSTANFAIRIVGYALTAEDLLFNPSNDYIVHV